MLSNIKDLMMFDSSLLPKDNFLSTGSSKIHINKIIIPKSNMDFKQFISIIYLLLFRYANRTLIPLVVKKKGKLWINETKIEEGTFIEYYKSIQESEIIELVGIEEKDIPIIFEIIENKQIKKNEHEINEIKFVIYDTNFEIIYNTTKYTEDTINKFIDNFRFLYKQIMNNPNKNIYAYGIVSEKEKKQIENFNYKKKKYYHGETIISEFYKMLKENKDKIAAICGERKITYEELNNITNYYANKIKNYPDKRVGLFMKDDLSTYIGCFSILKAGKCIVTINPTYPVQRIEKIKEQLDLKLILTCELLEGKLNECECTSIRCGLNHYRNIKMKDVIPEIDARKESYIIFTSGTTGVPKGVIITEKNIMIEINYLEDRCHFEKNSKSLHILNYSFDFGLYDILANLIKGRCLCSLDKSKMKNFKDYINLINNFKIQNINTTPSFFNIISSFNINMPSLKYVHLGGEKVFYEMVKKYDLVLNSSCDLYNGYGPCETTVGNALHLITLNERKGKNIKLNSVPIGFPTDQSELYVLDCDENFVPINSIGELYVAGECIGKGYIDKEKNKDKFVYVRKIGNKKVYKTGDLVRWLPNGEIEFVSRKDNQIKKNGFRIELSEIDTVILKSGQVIQVISLFDTKKQMIITYVIAREKIFDEISLKNYLKKYLPNYMIPSKIIALKKFPMLESGKIDIRSLNNIIKEVN